MENQDKPMTTTTKVENMPYRQMFNILYLQYVNGMKDGKYTNNVALTKFECVASDIFNVFKVLELRLNRNYKMLYKAYGEHAIMKYDALSFDLPSLFDQLIVKFKEINSWDYVFEVPDMHKSIFAWRRLFYLINGKEL
jgi:hypothetical protein